MLLKTISIRRYFRIKSLQFLYAQKLSKIDSKKVEKNMLQSIEGLHDLYIYLLYLILKMRDRAIRINNKIKNKTGLIQRMAYNSILKTLSSNKYYLLEYRNLKNSKKTLLEKNEYILSFFLKEMNTSKIYKKFIQKSNFSFEEDKNFIIKFYRNFIISNNKKLIEYTDDLIYLNGSSDLYIAHMMVCKTLKFIQLTTPKNFKLYNIYKNKENKKFIVDLYRNTILYKEEFNSLIRDTSNNWDIKRISTIDLIILQMAICEFLYFPTIPPKATMNEYIEITKIFCMEKSKIFINGILDQVFKCLYKNKKIFKEKNKGIIK
ncbi:transcription antitermination factor NusB [Blattabacterium cuenoti]|uniref:transcription antitermination factor NusB n=1 Tax=Blattabacterium cuenoti TaxID=1653831 RepID=UPI00163BC3FA|nr:transcription antitermination factor NusB [Blattabacterium cuenoti]